MLSNQAQAQAQAQLSSLLAHQQIAMLHAQQQAILHSFRPRQTGIRGQPGHENSDDTMTAVQQQQARAVSMNSYLQAHLQVQAQAQRAILAAQLQRNTGGARYDLPSHSPAALQRAAIAAQVQVNMLARTTCAQKTDPNDADLHRRFEDDHATSDAYRTPANASTPVFGQMDSPQAYIPLHDAWRSVDSPIASSTEKMYTSSPKAQAGQDRRSDFNSPSSRLVPSASRRQAPRLHNAALDCSDGVNYTETTATPAVLEHGKTSVIQALGRGRPTHTNSTSRAWSTPITTRSVTETAPRASSYSGPIRAAAIRQPIGPPGGAEELGEKNFQSR